MVIDWIQTFDQNKIANGLNKYFTEIGPKLAPLISPSSKVFKQFMNVSKIVSQEYALQDQELEAFNSLKPNKRPGFDDISSSAVNLFIFLIFHCKLEFLQMEWKLHEFHQFLKKVRNSPLLITGQYQCCHVSPNCWRG